MNTRTLEQSAMSTEDVGTTICEEEHRHLVLSMKIEELIASESSYIDWITKPGKVPNDDKELEETVFRNLEDIINLSNRFLEKLNYWKEHKESIPFSDCFYELQNEFKRVYGAYCIRYDDKMTVLEVSRKNPMKRLELDHKLEKLRELGPCESLEAILIMPVQRIMRYPMILKGILDETEEEGFASAYEIMKRIADEIDEEKQKFEALDVRRKVTSHSSRSRISSYIFDIGAHIYDDQQQVPSTPVEFQGLVTRFNNIFELTKALKKRILKLQVNLSELVNSQSSLAESINDYYDNQATDSKSFLQISKGIQDEALKDIQRPMDNVILPSLNELLNVFNKIAELITRRERMITECKYMTLSMNMSNEQGKRSINHKLTFALRPYETLHKQLSNELPVFTESAENIVHSVSRAVLSSRKRFLMIQSRYIFKLQDIATQLPISANDDIETCYEIASKKACSILENFAFVKENRDNSQSSIPVPGILRRKTDSSKDTVGENMFTAVSGFSASRGDEITLQKGEVVAVVKKQGSMSKVRVDGRTGMVPNCILRRYNPYVDKGLGGACQVGVVKPREEAGGQQASSSVSVARSSSTFKGEQENSHFHQIVNGVFQTDNHGNVAACGKTALPIDSDKKPYSSKLGNYSNNGLHNNSGNRDNSEVMSFSCAFSAQEEAPPSYDSIFLSRFQSLSPGNHGITITSVSLPLITQDEPDSPFALITFDDPIPTSQTGANPLSLRVAGSDNEEPLRSTPEPRVGPMSVLDIPVPAPRRSLQVITRTDQE